MNKLSKVSILSILLLSGCSYSSLLSDRYQNPVNNNSTNSSSYKIEFVVPNDTNMDNIINSPAFFDSKWLNASCLRSTWKSAIVLKIGNAVKDIGYILSLQIRICRSYEH